MEVGAFHVGTTCPWFDRLLVAALRKGRSVVGVEVATRHRLAAKERARRLGFDRRNFNPMRLRRDFVKSGKKSWGVVVEGLSTKQLGFLRRFCAVQDILLVVWSDPNPDVSAFPYTHYVLAGGREDPYVAKGVAQLHGWNPPAGVYNREGKLVYAPPPPPTQKKAGGSAPDNGPTYEGRAPTFDELYQKAQHEAYVTMQGLLYPHARAHETIYTERRQEPPENVDTDLWYAFDGSGLVVPFRGPASHEAAASLPRLAKEIEKHYQDPKCRLYVTRMAAVFSDKYSIEPYLKDLAENVPAPELDQEEDSPRDPWWTMPTIMIIVIFAAIIAIYMGYLAIRYWVRKAAHSSLVATLKGQTPKVQPPVGFWDADPVGGSEDEDAGAP